MYVSLGQYRRRYPKDNITDDTLKTEIEDAGKVVDEYCNTRFIPTAYYSYIDFSHAFYTQRAPLLSVVSLSVNKKEMTENEEYFVYAEERKIEIAASVSQPAQPKKAIFLHYLYGYEEVPQTVKEVIMDLIHMGGMIAAGEISESNIKSESWDGEYSYETADASKSKSVTDMQGGILSRLDRYRVAAAEELPKIDMDAGSVRAWLV